MSTLGHHWRVLKQALVDERGRKRTNRAHADVEFLPAALEVIERPVSPTARITVWVMIVGLMATIIWLTFGKVDVVASAQGKILPAGAVKLVQAANTGVVRRIYVRDGDVVRRAQPLIDLDPTVSTAEQEQAGKALLAAEIDVARNRAIADALSGKGIRFSPPDGTPPEVAETQRRLIAAQVAESEATAAGMAAARQSSLAEARSAAEQIKKYDSTLPVLDKEIDAMNGLSARGYAPGLRLLELQRQRHGEVGDRGVAAAQRARGLSDARKFGQSVTQAREQARQQALADLAKAQNEVIIRREELTKARRRSRLQQLVAPVAGSIQQLSVHTIGGVVEAVRTLMVVVPNGAISVEVKVLNKDAGFVRVGQPVAVKLEAFPFTRHGTIPGRISWISGDAVDDRRSGLVYIAHVELLKNAINRGDVMVPLSAGMNVTADIQTDRRSILSYLVSPIDRARLEAGRER